MDLSTSVTRLPAVRGQVTTGLQRLHIRTVRDLLFHFPWRHEDRRVITPIADARPDMRIVARGLLSDLKTEQSFRRFRRGTRPVLVTTGRLSDETSSIGARWFHQRYLERTYPPGTHVYMYGTVDDHGDLVAPDIERVHTDQPPLHVGRLVPIYPETSGVSSRMLRYLVARALPLAADLREYLPEATRAGEHLLDIPTAVAQMHFPADEMSLGQARERLSFDELLILQLAALVRRAARASERAPVLPLSLTVVADAVAALPFVLTATQQEALRTIFADLGKPVPMARLLAGDVGSGKTVVAGLVALALARAGGQTVLLAPTEILAQQHAESLGTLLGPHGLRSACLTASTPVEERATLIAEATAGRAHLLVGTHALLHAPLTFENLTLVIVDEQHRFGVLQRGALTTKGAGGHTPHFLSLSATPIPRTLQLTAYGDVDVSPLDRRPEQRSVRTEIITPPSRNTMYATLKNRIAAGGQVFVVCPRVEPEEEKDGDARGAAERKSVETEYRRLQKDLFRGVRLERLHGRMKPDEKTRIVEAFRRGALDLLVASTVIEVGIDIPNADTLLVESAEHFGLATLHQLRGRVGRRGQNAVCFLATEAVDLDSVDRLQVLVRTTNGLEIAEEDLRRRGPGELYGTRQHGGVTLKVASLADLPFLLRVRAAAERLLAADTRLSEAPLLAARIRQLTVATHFE